MNKRNINISIDKKVKSWLFIYDQYSFELSILVLSVSLAILLSGNK